MTAAIFGLVGVVIGGLLTAGADWMVERRRERAATRAAARLVLLDLSETFAQLAVSSARKIYAFGLAGGELTTEAWSQHREQLAVALTEAEWSAVSGAYQRIGFENQKAVDRALGEAIPGGALASLDQAAEPLAEAIKVLAARQADGKKMLEAMVQGLGRAGVGDAATVAARAMLGIR